MARRLLIRGLLVTCGALAGVAAAEIGLRAVTGMGQGGVDDLSGALSSPASGTVAGGPVTLAHLLRPSGNPDRVYELRPGLDCVFKGVRVTTNSFGMRDGEVSQVKPPGTLRVVGLGDSVMFGWGVEVEEGYMEVAEKMLGDEASAAGTVTCLNFGVPGYNTAMQAALFRDLAAGFDPDALVIHFVNNDLDLPRFMLEPVDRWAVDRLWLVDLVRGGWSSVPGRETWLSPRDVADMQDRRGARVRAKYAHLAGVEPFRRAMAELAEEARVRSIPAVLLTLQEDGEPWATGAAVARENGIRVAAAGPRFLSYMATRGIEPSRSGWTRTFSVSAEDPHPNVTGHQIFAETLVDALTEALNVHD